MDKCYKRLFLCIYLLGTLVALTLVVAINTDDTEASVVVSGSCDSDVYWELDNRGTLTITGTGIIPDNENMVIIRSHIWGDYSSQIKEIQIGHGITYIGKGAFMACDYCTSITIPDSVTLISEKAFSDCSSLTSITIPDSVFYIGEKAFCNCTSLASLVISDNVSFIGDGAFYGCWGLKEITLPISTNVVPTNNNLDLVFGNCKSIERVYFTKGTGEGFNYGINSNSSSSGYYGCTPWYISRQNLKTITFGDGVKSIGSYAFYGCTSLTSVSISDNVESIGSYAFKQCSSLTSLYIPNSVKYVGDYAFNECTSLVSLTFDDSTTVIDDFAFLDCSSLSIVTLGNNIAAIGGSAFNGTALTSIILPDSVIDIGPAAFRRCSSLTSITIPDSVLSVGNYAFEDCTSLESITIGNGVTYIGTHAFWYCTSLESVTNRSLLEVGRDNELFTHMPTEFIGQVNTVSQFDFTVKYNDYSKICSISSYTGSHSEVNIDSLVVDGIEYSIISIEDNCFSNNSQITSVSIGDSVRSIGSAAFVGCTSIINLSIGDNVRLIGPSAFGECTSLRELTLPISLNAVSSNSSPAFIGCTNIERVNFTKGTGYGFNYGTDSSASLSDYFGYAPWQYSSLVLQEITFENSILSIGPNMFYGCTSLTTIILPDSVRSIGPSAFGGCTSLRELTLPISLNAVSSNSSPAFIGCTGIERVNFTKGTGYGFNYGTDCSVQYSDYFGYAPWHLSQNSLIEVSLSGNIQSVGSYTFYECEKVKVIHLIGDTTRVGDYAFYNCSSLSDVYLDGISEIGDYAFYGCQHLKSVSGMDSLSTVGDHSFSDCSSLASSFIIGSNSYIGDYAFFNCMRIEFISIGSDVTQIGDYAFKDCTTSTIVFDGSSIKSVGDYAFYNCSGLQSAALGNELESIGDYAFYCCVRLSSPIHLGESLGYVGDYAFYNCTKIPSLTFAEGNVNLELGISAFQGCSNLSGELNLPDRISIIGSAAFCNCISLTSVNMPSNLTTIENNSFYGCTNLTDIVNVPEYIDSIGDYAFYGCRSMSGPLILPQTLRSVGKYAFANCTSIAGELSVPSTVSSIGEHAFERCVEIENVSFNGGMTSICEGAFNNCKGIRTIIFVSMLYDIESDAFTNCGICYVECPGTFSLGVCEGTLFCYSYQYFAVRFLNDDLSVLSSALYRYIDDIVPPADPVKMSTVEYTYTFTGWQGFTTGIHVTQDTDFIAGYSSTVNGYTITWKNYDDSILAIDEHIPYGSAPIYHGTLPIKPYDLDYAYVFDSWNPLLSPVTGDAEYVAMYSSYPRYSTVTWKNYDGAILEIDLDVEYGSLPTFEGSVPERGSSSQYSYVFASWSPEITAVSGDVTYVAVFNGILNEYTITWKNYDGFVLETDTNVEYGQIPSYDGVIPQRESNAQFTYTFSNWSPTVSETKGNTTYTAVFSTITNKYVVTWKNDDNTVLETDINVPYGTAPSYDGPTPVKASDAQYAYVFNGWTPVIADVSGNITYFATYNQFSKYSTVIWKNYDGTVLETDTDVEFGTRPTYNGSIPMKDPVAEYAYQFSNWSPAIEPVSGDATYIAVFNQYPRYSTVIWRNYDGAVLETDTDVEFGFIPVYDGEVPTRAANAQYTYTFSNWSPSVGPVSGNTTFTAVFSQTVNRYTVTWMNWDGTVLENDTNIEYGTVPIYDSSVPSRTNTPQYTYTFLGWSPSVSSVTTNVTYMAMFTQTLNKYTVSWKNYDGSLLEIDADLEYGILPSYDGNTPSRMSDERYTYTFTGWSPTVSPVTSSTSYTAQYSQTINRYTVTWKNYDGTTLEIDSGLEYGSIPSYDGSTPFRPSNDQYNYSFTNWSPAVSSVSGNETYTAVFSQTLNRYTVLWKNEDGTVLETDLSVEYGSMPVYDGIVPTKASTAQFTYSFTNWSPTVSAVMGNVSYTAVFAASVNSYSVTWKNWDGTVLENDPSVAYGSLPTYDGAPPTRSATAQFAYSFTNWSPTVSTVIGDAVYVANYDSSVNLYDVTFTVNDVSLGTVSRAIISDVPYGSKVSISGNTATLYGTSVSAIPVTSNAQFAYSFTGWSHIDQYEITGDCTIRASFTRTLNSYTVTWKNYDGSVLETDLGVAYGSTPSYDGLEPSRPSNAQYTYQFVNWSPSVNDVTQNVTYTAAFSSSVNKYTVTWKNYDGTTLETDTNVEYGTTPVYDGTTPMRAANDQYSYSFSNWSPEVTNVADNSTYYAVYAQTVNRYTVTWKNYDGSTLEIDMDVEYGTMPSYNGSTPGKGSNAQYTYSFSGWSPTVSALRGNVTYTATFDSTVNTYAVTWKNYDGSVLEVDTSVEYGDMSVFDGTQPSRSGSAQYSYRFVEWAPTVTSVTGNSEYTAVFERLVNEYTVSIVVNNGDYGSVTHDGVTNVPYGTKLSISENVAVVNGTHVNAIALQDTAQYRYGFDSWSLPDFYEVTGNVVLKANFSRNVNSYTVTWKNYDGTTLEIDSCVEYGAIPNYDGNQPSRASSERYAYSFSGWNPALSSVTGNVEYTAVLIETPRTYTVSFNVEGVAYRTAEYRYDDLLLLPADPVKESTIAYDYSFTGWSGYVSGMTVTADYIFDAVFDAERIVYSLTFVDSDGSRTVRNYIYGDRTVDEPDPYAHAPAGSIARWEDYSFQYDNRQVVNIVYYSYLDYESTVMTLGSKVSRASGILGTNATGGSVAVCGTNEYLAEWYNHIAGSRYIEIPDVSPDGRSVVSIKYLSDSTVTDIRFGQSIQEVYQNALSSCTSLKTITVSNSTHFSTGNGALLSDSGRTLVAVPSAVGEVFEIPSSVRTVSSGAISGNVKKLLIDTRNDSIIFEDNANNTGNDLLIEALSGSHVVALSSAKLAASNQSLSLGVESLDYFGEKTDDLIISVLAVLVVMIILQVASVFLSKSLDNKYLWIFLAPVMISCLTMFIYTMYESISLQTDPFFKVAMVLWLIATFIEFGATFYATLSNHGDKSPKIICRNGRTLIFVGIAIALFTSLSMMILAYLGIVHVVEGLPAYLIAISVSLALISILGIIASRKIFVENRYLLNAPLSDALTYEK